MTLFENMHGIAAFPLPMNILSEIYKMNLVADIWEVRGQLSPP